MTAKILAIETSTSACSLALRHNGEILSYFEVGNNIHSQRLLPEVASLLDRVNYSLRDIDAIAVGQGPGSFTGLRIGVGVGQGLAFGAGCPMLGVGSLHALAMASPEDGLIVSGIDARMGEIYLQVFEKTGQTLVAKTNPEVLAPHSLNTQEWQIDPELEVFTIGNAWKEYESEIEDILIREAYKLNIDFPDARQVLEIAELMPQESAVVASDFLPLYVRNKVAKKAGESS